MRKITKTIPIKRKVRTPPLIGFVSLSRIKKPFLKDP